MYRHKYLPTLSTAKTNKLPQQQQYQESDEQKSDYKLNNNPLQTKNIRFPKLQQRHSKYNTIRLKTPHFSSPPDYTIRRPYEGLTVPLKYRGGIFEELVKGFTEATRIKDSSLPDKSKDRIYKGWEVDPHDVPFMVKVKVCVILSIWLLVDL